MNDLDLVAETYRAARMKLTGHPMMHDRAYEIALQAYWLAHPEMQRLEASAEVSHLLSQAVVRYGQWVYGVGAREPSLTR